MLNCFSNNTAEQKLQSDVKKISRLITTLGFKRENIYVCDLRKSTEGSQEMVDMWGFPSYVEFKNECVNGMLAMGLISKYSWIYDSWKAYFKDNLAFIENKLMSLKDNLEDGENRIEMYKNRISCINAVQLPDINTILEEARRKYDEFYSYIEMTFCGKKRGTGLFWHNRERRDACIEIIDAIDKLLAKGELESLADKITEAVKYGINEIETVSEMYLDEPLKKPEEIIFTMAIENIKEKLLTADEYTRAWNKSDKTSYYLKQIKEMIDVDYELSVTRAKSYFLQVLNVFSTRKIQTLNTLEEELSGIGNPEIIKQKILYYRNMNNMMIEYEKSFKKTINIDVLRSR